MSIARESCSWILLLSLALGSCSRILQIISTTEVKQLLLLGYETKNPPNVHSDRKAALSLFFVVIYELGLERK